MKCAHLYIWPYIYVYAWQVVWKSLDSTPVLHTNTDLSAQAFIHDLILLSTQRLMQRALADFDKSCTKRDWTCSLTCDIHVKPLQLGLSRKVKKHSTTESLLLGMRSNAIFLSCLHWKIASIHSWPTHDTSSVMFCSFRTVHCTLL